MSAQSLDHGHESSVRGFQFGRLCKRTENAPEVCTPRGLFLPKRRAPSRMKSGGRGEGLTPFPIATEARAACRKPSEPSGARATSEASKLCAAEASRRGGECRPEASAPLWFFSVPAKRRGFPKTLLDI